MDLKYVKRFPDIEREKSNKFHFHLSHFTKMKKFDNSVCGRQNSKVVTQIPTPWYTITFSQFFTHTLI